MYYSAPARRGSRGLAGFSRQVSGDPVIRESGDRGQGNQYI